MKAKDLRNSILQMAVQGKLVPQDPNDEPASVLLNRIRAERAKLIKEKKIKAPKDGESVIYRGSDGSHYEKRGNCEPVCIDDEIPFEIPESWEWCRFGSICTKLTDGSHNPPPKQTSGYPVISAMNIKRGDIDLSLTQRFTDRKGFEKENPRTRITRGDIILGIIGGSIGNAAIFQHDEEVIAQRSIAIIDTLGLNEYAYWAIQSPLFFSYYSAASGTAQGGVYLGAIAEMLLPIPPLFEQGHIVSRVTGLLRIVDSYGALEDARERLDAELPERLRKSILQEAVRGRLVPQDPSDEPASALLGRIRAERASLVKAGKLKAPKGGESVIYRGSDGGYYEKRGKGEPQPVVVPFDIPESWAWARLGSIVLNRVQTKPTSDFCYIDIGSIDNSRLSLNNTDTVIAAKDAPSRARKPVAMDDVLYSTVRPYLHNVCIVDREFSHTPIASTGFAVMVCPTGFSESYLLRVLISPFFDAFSNDNENSKGVAYPAINDARLYSALIPVPPADEQCRIVLRIQQLEESVS